MTERLHYPAVYVHKEEDGRYRRATVGLAVASILDPRLRKGEGE